MLSTIMKTITPTTKSKGQAWIGVIITGVIGIVIAAQVLFGQLGSIKQAINSTAMTTAEQSIANLVPFVLIAGFVLVTLGLFLFSKKS